jgi:UDP-N-acetylglucosamine--N-acetylmuramyl-(pentapeptide) pyrophosphoryl-undecaprenol N-acetylglucosamine transferase
MTKSNTKTIFLAGGQTGGPIMPLFAIAQTLQQHGSFRFVVFDTATSTAKRLIPHELPGAEFIALPAAKLARYWTWKNFVAPFVFVFSLMKSWQAIRTYRPALILGAGGFAQVPLMITAKLHRIPCVIHQQDIMPSLSNQICGPLATRITTTFNVSSKAMVQTLGMKGLLKTSKVVWTGNPNRAEHWTATKADGQKFFQLSPNKPILLVVGGGSGAQALNRLVEATIPELTKFCQILHATGIGKEATAKHPDYHSFAFIDRMDLAYAASDIVLCRAGVGTITELALTQKPSLVAPIPDSHQEANAGFLLHHNAAGIINQDTIDSAELAQIIRKLLLNGDEQQQYRKNIAKLLPPHSSETYAKLVLELLQ